MLPAFILPLIFLGAVFSRLDEKIAFPGKFWIPPGTRILILGDSHAVCSLDPGRIGKAVNFSSDGESYVQNYYKLKYALRCAPSLRTVILPVDLHSFSDFRAKRIMVDAEWSRYIDFLEIGKLRKKRFHYFYEWLKLRCFGFRGRYERFYRRWILGRKTVSVSRLDRGFLPYQGIFIKKNSMARGQKRAFRQLKGYNIFSPEMVFFFKKILDLARQHELNIILLRFPFLILDIVEAFEFICHYRQFDDLEFHVRAGLINANPYA